MRVAVVTGASSGIGAVTVDRLVDAGFRVFGVGRNRDALLAAARASGIAWAEVDLADAAAVERLIPTVLQQLGRVVKHF